VTVVAATKYVAARTWRARGCGYPSSERNRARTCSGSTRTSPTGSGGTSSAPAVEQGRVVNEICELVHAVDTDSAARRLTVPWLLEVNLTGEASKSASRRARSRLRRALPLLCGLMTMPPFADDPEASRPMFRRLAGLARDHGLAQLSMGTSRTGGSRGGGATLIRVGSTLFHPAPRPRCEAGRSVSHALARHRFIRRLAAACEARRSVSHALARHRFIRRLAAACEAGRSMSPI